MSKGIMALSDFLSIQLLEFIYVVTFCFVVYSVVTSSLCTYVTSVTLLYLCLKTILRKTAGSIAVKGQGVFITGCDTGFGNDLARRLDELGFTVFAGCLKPDGDGAKNLKKDSLGRLHVVPVDVGSDDSVHAAHEYVVKHLPKTGLWAIVNNAGFNVMGDVEWLTVNLFHKVMNVNFYGAVRTVRTFLHLVRRTKGRVVIVSSVKGMSPWPADAAYHVTKHAIETMTDSLRLEMQKFGVKVAKVRPGNFSSVTACQNAEHFKRYREEADEMWENASSDVRRTYGRQYLDEMIRKQEGAMDDSASTTAPVIDAIVDGIMSERPHTAYLIDGGQGWIDKPATLGRYYGYLPTWLSDWIICKLSKCDRFPDYSKLKAQ